MTGLVVRPATAADAELLAELRYELRTSLARDIHPEVGFRERCAAWMAARLRNPEVWRCWLAEDASGRPLGVVWIQFLEKLPTPVHEPELHAYLTGLYVRAETRNRGVGSALLEAALAACHARGCDSVILWPTERSQPLYLRHGFTERTGMMLRRLAAAAAPAS
jgi:GNAT superfamily N-acetyltransferase